MSETIATAAGPVSSRLTVTVNGEEHSEEIDNRLLLVHFLRQKLGLTGTHVGCDTSHCGACTVLLDGIPVKSCTVLAVQTEAHDVTTVEGLATGGELHPIQTAFHEQHGLQCGYCTPGIVMAATFLLRRNPEPTEEEIRRSVRGNICRCTGYVNIVEAIRSAAEGE